MASTKIQNLPLKAPIGAMKIPTGGFGDYSITVSSIGDFIIDAFNLATKDYVDNLLVEKEDRIDLTGGYLTPTSQNANVPNTTNDVIDEVAQALLDRIEYVKDIFGNRPLHNELDGRSEINSHPSTSISHGSGTVFSKFSSLDSNLNNINNNLIPNINNNILLKEDKIVNGDNFSEEISFSSVPSTNSSSLNTSLQALANRDEFLNVQLKKGITPTFDQAFVDKIGGYPLNARIILSNGDIVKNTVPNNTVNPNMDMTGWVLDNAASQIKFSDGTSVQGLYDVYKLKDYAFVTPEMFGAVANIWETDNTAALNAAFATGKDVYSTPDKVYTCNGNLRTKGQRLLGGWKIRTSKTTVGTPNWTNTANTYADPCDFSYLQGIYFAYAYDLSEFLAVRDLGYNTLLHYGGMHISGFDNDGDVQNLLDNAKSAGLQVLLGTQNSLNGMTIEEFVNTYKDHPALLGFLIADEPFHNGITVAQQKEKIDLMRGLTNKPLACSDFKYDAFTEVLADGYDYIFGDIYNDAGETAEQTLYKMRAWLGLTHKRHPESKVLPTVMGFKYNGGVDIPTIIQTSKIFAKACGGNFACFVWDGLGEPSISNSIRDTVSLQGLSREICGYKTGVYQIPECYAWGTITEQSSQVVYGINDALKHRVGSDPNSTTLFEGTNSYPAQMNGGAAEGDRTSPYITSGQAIAGIWFKHSFGAYVSDITMNKYNYMTVQSGMLSKGGADVILGVRGSSDGGYSLGATLATLPNDLSVATLSFEVQSKVDAFCIKYDCSVDPQYYRTFVRAVYVTSNW